MDEVTKEIASRYLGQIEQLGPEKPELLDAALHGNVLIIVLCDGRKLRFDTDKSPPAAQEASKPFAYTMPTSRQVEEAIKEEQAKSKKGKPK